MQVWSVPGSTKDIKVENGDFLRMVSIEFNFQTKN